MKYLVRSTRVFIIYGSCIGLLLGCVTRPPRTPTLGIDVSHESACSGSLVVVSWVNRRGEPATLSSSALTEPPFRGQVNESGSMEISINETTTFTIDTVSTSALSATSEIAPRRTILSRDYTLPWLGCSNGLEHGELVNNNLPSGSTIKTVVSNTYGPVRVDYGGGSVWIEQSEETTKFAGLPANGRWHATQRINREFFSDPIACASPEAVVIEKIPTDIDITVNAACTN